MNTKTFKLIIIICLLLLTQFCQASAGGITNATLKDSSLRIYLPREITIKDDVVSLGQVSIIRGEESLVTKASRIMLGRMSLPGQSVVVDRPTLLSRLVCSGIALSNVRLTGAEKIKVKQQLNVIKGGKFVELAGSFVKKKLSDSSSCQLSPIWIPKDLDIPDTTENVTLSPVLAGSSTRSRAKVQIAVLADEKEIGTREVTFRLRSENVKIEKEFSNYPEPANWNPPYGLVAKRRIPAKITVKPYMVGQANPEVSVKRNQTVVIQIKSPGLMITAMGKALQDGCSGEYIKVRNVDSRRIILARVNEDGYVEPVF
ncbi:MAG: flagellar basal body P-ring formation chaperone FlgA [Planctomycetota bacterium]|jgi:flagella basal body P-ring formation protein FlgA